MSMSATQRNALKKAIIQALRKSLGVVTPACEIVGIEPSTFYRWYKSDQKFKEQVDSLQCVAHDFVETKLFKRIKEESDTAIIFYLKTKCKHRGYVERQEIKLEDVTPKSDEDLAIEIERRLAIAAKKRDAAQKKGNTGDGI
jgi:hypothetical protein